MECHHLCKQCVPGPIFSSPKWRPVNKFNTCTSSSVQYKTHEAVQFMSHKVCMQLQWTRVQKQCSYVCCILVASSFGLSLCLVCVSVMHVNRKAEKVEKTCTLWASCTWVISWLCENLKSRLVAEHTNQVWNELSQPHIHLTSFTCLASIPGPPCYLPLFQLLLIKQLKNTKWRTGNKASIFTKFYLEMTLNCNWGNPIWLIQHNF